MKLRFTPRPYQEKAVELLRENYRRKIRRQVLVIPTAGGKTGCAAMIIELAIAKGNTVVFLAHRKELIDQCSKTLDFFGVEHGVIKSGHWRERPDAPVQVASVQTLIRRKIRPRASVVILDEAHRSLNATNQAILGWYPDALSLGLTGTPERRDGRGLCEMYEAMVEPIKMSELIEQGYILPTRVFEPERPDLTGIGRVGGDYNLEQVAARVMTTHRNGSLVENWEEYGEGRQTIVSAINVEDSKAIAARFNERKIPAEHLDGTMPDGKRDAILARLASGETRVVTQCDVLVEGYDLPSVGCIVLARPTLSVTRFLQMIGRGVRLWEDQRYAIVLDHAGCCSRPQLGDPSRDREWSLEGRKKRPQITTDVAMITCDKCSLMRSANVVACPKCSPSATQVSMFMRMPIEIEGMLVERKRDEDPTPPTSSTVRQCKKCGASRMTSTRHNDLKIRWRCDACCATEFDVDADAARKATEERRFAEYLALERARRSKGRKPGWSAHVYKSVFGTWPPREWQGRVDGILGKETA